MAALQSLLWGLEGGHCGWDVSRCGDHSRPLSLGQDFVIGLSVLLRGTVQEKLNWAFNLYDINKDGFITKEVPRGTRRGGGGGGTHGDVQRGTKLRETELGDGGGLPGKEHGGVWGGFCHPAPLCTLPRRCWRS